MIYLIHSFSVMVQKIRRCLKIPHTLILVRIIYNKLKKHLLGTINRYFYLANRKSGKNRCFFFMKLLFFPGTAFSFKIINKYNFHFLELKNIYFQNLPVRNTFLEFPTKKFKLSNNKNPRY